MFTGIVTDIGRIQKVEPAGDTKFVIASQYDSALIAIGASICCSGVCLTVVDKAPGWFSVTASAETLACSNLAGWRVGTAINLERSLKLGDELGGHIASKGSVCLNGVSLTVNEVDEEGFGINFIPHTQEMTTFGTAEIGDRVNLEIDVLARYVARLAQKETL
jgi:riboflavin synthase